MIWYISILRFERFLLRFCGSWPLISPFTTIKKPLLRKWRMKVETKIPVSMDRHHVTTLLRVCRGVSAPFHFHHQTEGSNSMATNFLLISWKQELESSVTYEISHYRGTTARHLHYKMLLHKTTPLCKCPFSIEKKERFPSSEPS
jgi:hypothetical protein